MWRREKPTVSVVLPAFNEGIFIEKGIKKAMEIPYVDEVIVVDGGSTDDTVKRARRAGAKVLHQTWVRYPGKGIAMRDAVEYASGDIVVFMDADIKNVRKEMIEMLADPIIRSEADFVKGAFGRRAGRVTELVAKPLLKYLFPEYAHYAQPLSGEIAGKREVLKSVKFEENWGVDVGLLIDLSEAGYRVKEVNIGFKEHDMKPLYELSGMAQQVAVAILKRAAKRGRLRKLGKL